MIIRKPYSPNDGKRHVLQSNDRNNRGIGDALNGLIAIRPEWVYHCLHWDWVKLFHTNVAMLNGKIKAPSLSTGYDIEARTKGKRWERYCKLVGTTPKIPPLIDRDKLTEMGSEWKGYIALAPFCCWKDRQWTHWQELETLLINAGERLVILDDKEERCKVFQSEKVIKQSPATVASVLCNCKMLIGNDSGLAHAGGLIGCRTLVIAGKVDAERIFGCYPTCEWLERDGLHKITPKDVKEAVTGCACEQCIRWLVELHYKNSGMSLTPLA